MKNQILLSVLIVIICSALSCGNENKTEVPRTTGIESLASPLVTESIPTTPPIEATPPSLIGTPHAQEEFMITRLGSHDVIELETFGFWEIAIEEDKIVWLDYRDDNYGIYLHDLSTGIEECIGEPANKWGWPPDINRNIVAWDGIEYDIHVYNLENRDQETILKGMLHELSDGMIAWHLPDFEKMGQLRYMKIPREDSPILTIPGPSTRDAFSIDGNIVVWEDYRNVDYDEPVSDWNTDIYGCDLYTGKVFPICIAPGLQRDPRIKGNTVIWLDRRENKTAITTYPIDISSDRYPVNDIYGYNLETQTEFAICTHESMKQNINMDSNIVVWTDFRNDDPLDIDTGDIYAYDLVTSTEFSVCTNDFAQMKPSVSGDTIVWLDCRVPIPEDQQTYSAKCYREIYGSILSRE